MQSDPLDFERCADVAARLILDADGLLVCAGAGMGVDSGLPDFRGTQGFWSAYPALGAARIRFEQIANPDAFASDPRRAWGFYGHRLRLYRRTRPHEGFGILRRIGAGLLRSVAVFTSNVDGQFQRAGFGEQSVTECHGSIHWLQCARPCCTHIWQADTVDPEVDESNCMLLSELPRCPACGGLARPNILMFGDSGWLPARTDTQLRRLDRWMARVSRPVAIELGAGSAIPTVRMYAQQSGGALVRINPSEPDVGRVPGVGIACGALAGLRAIQSALMRVKFSANPDGVRSMGGDDASG